MNQDKLSNCIIKKSKKSKENSMFKFCINRKIFNFFDRKEYNFLYRLTSYRLIRILCRQNAGSWQAMCKLNAGSWQAMCRQLAGSWQAKCRQLKIFYKDEANGFTEKNTFGNSI
jgi:hypothetical protein